MYEHFKKYVIAESLSGFSKSILHYCIVDAKTKLESRFTLYE